MAQAVTIPVEDLDYYARVRQSSLDLAKTQYKEIFRARANEFIRGKGTLAVVSEPICMGCTHCFDNCAFEAIDMRERKFALPDITYQSRKAMIVTENCVGCEKCAIVCPVDAITMVPKPGWVVAEGRLKQTGHAVTLEKPFRQPPKPGEPRPPVEAQRFTFFREEAKKQPAAPPPAPTAPAAPVSAPAAEAAAEAPKAAPKRPPPAKAAPSRPALTPEEIRKRREEARKRAEAAREE